MFETEHHAQVSRDFRAAILGGRMVALTAVIGSGKTILSRRLRAEMEREGRVIVLRSLSVEKVKITVPLLISALFYDLTPDKTVTISSQSERRERDLQELFRRAKKPVALFVDDAHDLHPKTLVALNGVDQDEKAVLRRNVRRAELEAFFTKLPPTVVALEACGGSHLWGRRLAALGHTVRLIPPQYVKPFVRCGKNDRNDAEAICEAASRPSMPSVPMKANRSWLGSVRAPLRSMAWPDAERTLDRRSPGPGRHQPGRQRAATSTAGARAMAVIRDAKPGSKSASAWLLALLERKPRKLAAVAPANKMARIVWAMMAGGEAYRGIQKVATLATATAAMPDPFAGARVQEGLQEMMIGRSDARVNPGRTTASPGRIIVVVSFANPSGPAVIVPHQRPDT